MPPPPGPGRAVAGKVAMYAVPTYYGPIAAPAARLSLEPLPGPGRVAAGDVAMYAVPAYNGPVAAPFAYLSLVPCAPGGPV